MSRAHRNGRKSDFACAWGLMVANQRLDFAGPKSEIGRQPLDWSTSDEISELNCND
ncbi:hypothetical protein NC653_034366 [Populus alba x Populus x berolinensis]|uniref:Uncharacterized protein n=1 Tax=Populus alba x Populus x berolinensis TaxID=444605 RepID=A0AAD6LMC7_9ROSI|nr:hypothetical protein NC653_034366 [Populus alba x Populus x berolinensis]